MDSFFLLHVSDSHLSLTNRNLTRRPLRLGHFNRHFSGRANDFDLVIHSGDIADDGSDENLGFAKLVMTADRVPLGSLGRASFPGIGWASGCLALIPGNHDRYRSTKPATKSRQFAFPKYSSPGGRAFDDCFDEIGCWRSGSYCYRRDLAKGESRVAFIGADFTLPEGLGKTGIRAMLSGPGMGKVDDKRLAELSRLTDEANSEGVAGIFWIVHFPPAFRSGTLGHSRDANQNPQSWLDSRLLGLEDEEKLIDLAVSKKVAGIFSGHTHRDCYGYAFRRQDCRTRVYCTGDLFGSQDSAEYHLVSIDVTPGQPVAVRAVAGNWDSVHQCYRESPVQL